MCQFVCEASCSKIIESLYFKRGARNRGLFYIQASGNPYSCLLSRPLAHWPQWALCSCLLAVASGALPSCPMPCGCLLWPCRSLPVAGGQVAVDPRDSASVWLGWLAARVCHVLQPLLASHSLSFLPETSRSRAPEMDGGVQIFSCPELCPQGEN